MSLHLSIQWIFLYSKYPKAMLETSRSLSFSVWKDLQCFEFCQNTPRIIQMQSLFETSIQWDTGCGGGKERKSPFLPDTSVPPLLCLCSLVQSSCVNVKSNKTYNTIRNMSNWSIKGLASGKSSFSVFFVRHFFQVFVARLHILPFHVEACIFIVKVIWLPKF